MAPELKSDLELLADSLGVDVAELRRRQAEKLARESKGRQEGEEFRRRELERFRIEGIRRHFVENFGTHLFIALNNERIQELQSFNDLKCSCGAPLKSLWSDAERFDGFFNAASRNSRTLREVPIFHGSAVCLECHTSHSWMIQMLL